MDTKNTFENGMHIDNDYQAQPKGTYREMNNGEIFSIGGNNFAFKPTNGTSLNLTAPSIGSRYLGMIPARERLILFHHNEDQGLDYIGQIEKINDEEIYSVLYVGDLGFTDNNPITGYSYYEDDQTEKVYWTDGNVKPKSLNILGFTTGILAESSAGKKLLVRKGWVIHEGTTYSVGDSFILWTYISMSWSSDVDVIEYIEPTVLDWDIAITFKNELSFEMVVGSLMVGQYFISYRFITLNNDVTPWAPLSEPKAMLLTTRVKNTSGQMNFVKNWLSDQGGPESVNSGKGVEITINDIDPNKYRYIEYCAFRTSNIDIIETGVIFSRKEIDNTLLNYAATTVSSNAQLLSYSGENITLADFITESISIETVYDIDTIKGLNVAVNITEEQDISLGYKWEQDIEDPIKPLITETPADALDGIISDYSSSDPFSGIYDLDDEGYVREGCLLIGQYYKVYEDKIKYNSTYYEIGEVFLCTRWERAIEGAGKIKPVLRICKYMEMDGANEVPVFDYHVINSNNFPKGADSVFQAGYWGKETYRLGVLPYSLTGKKLPVRWLGDYTIPARESSSDFYSFDENNILNEDGGQITSFHYPLGPDVRRQVQTNTRQASLLVDLDLTDIIDEISGFSIVRAPRTKGRIAEGIADPLKHNTLGNLDVFVRSSDNYDTYSRWYYLYNELKMISDGDPDIQEGDTYNHTRTLKVQHEANFSNSYTQITGPYVYYEPYYRLMKAYDVLAEKEDSDVGIHSAQIVNTADMDIELLKEGKKFNNFVTGHATAGSSSIPAQQLKFNGAPISVLLELDAEKVWTQGRTIEDASTYHPCIIEKKRGVSEYNGTADEALQNTTYIPTGHYQAITPEFKAAIYKDGRHVAKNIQVLGGDCFVNLFSINRIIGNHSYFNDSENNKIHAPGRSDVIIVPIQSLANTDLRFGREPNYYGIYHDDDKLMYLPQEEVALDNYLYPEGNPGLWEEFKINNSFSNHYGGISYPSVSLLSKLTSEYKNRVRNSELKTTGNLIDAFTNFSAFDFIDIPGENGYITNIKSKGSKVFIWLTNGVAYIPVSEKATKAGALGETIYLGIGGQFERSDEIYKTFGNQHKFGLVETDDKFFWYDAYRKTLLAIGFNGQMTKESIIKGMDTFFQHDIPDDVDLNIFSGFNPKEKKVCFSFFTDDYTTVSKTISIDSKTQKFNSFYSYISGGYGTWLNNMYSTRHNRYYFYKHNIPESNSLLGNPYTSDIKFVISGEDELKKFMKMIFKGSNEFFNTIKYETMFDYNTNSFTNVVEENFNEYDYKFVIDEWRAGVPAGDLGRMKGQFMVITLTVNDNRKTVRLISVNTNYIKEY